MLFFPLPLYVTFFFTDFKTFIVSFEVLYFVTKAIPLNSASPASHRFGHFVFHYLSAKNCFLNCLFEFCCPSSSSWGLFRPSHSVAALRVKVHIPALRRARAASRDVRPFLQRASVTPLRYIFSMHVVKATRHCSFCFKWPTVL